MTKQEPIDIGKAAPAAARDRDATRQLPRAQRWPALLGFAVAVLLPTALGAVYWWTIAADRYVSEFRYSVRGGATMPEVEGRGGALGGSGALIYAADSFILEDYVTSVEALENVSQHAPLREMLGRDGDDPLRRYDPDAAVEDILPFWRSAVDAHFDATTGITTVAVSLYAPEDALAVARGLTAELRRVVDGLSEEARREMLRYIDGEYERAALALDEARASMETFRRDNRMISPEDEIRIGSGVISALSQQLANRRIELRAARERTPDSPRIAAIENEVAAIEAQLIAEIAARGGDAPSALPGQITSFDALQSAYEISRDTFINTLRLKQQAEAYSTLGRPELVVFVPPNPPEVATRPRRALETLKIFALALALWTVLRIFMASFRP